MPLLHIADELCPQGIVTFGILVADPNPNNIVNEPAVEEDLRGPSREYTVFVDGKVDCGPWRCGCDAHTSTGYLSPVYVPELDDVIFEHYFEGFDEGGSIIVMEGTSFFVAEEVGDVFECRASTDVGVH